MPASYRYSLGPNFSLAVSRSSNSQGVRVDFSPSFATRPFLAMDKEATPPVIRNPISSDCLPR